MSILASRGSLTVRDLSNEVGQWPQTVAQECANMKDAGLLVSDNNRPKHYSLALKAKVALELHDNTTLSFVPVNAIGDNKYGAKLHDIVKHSKEQLNQSPKCRTDTLEMVQRGWGSRSYFPLINKGLRIIRSELKIKPYFYYAGSTKALKRVLNNSYPTFCLSSPVVLEQFITSELSGSESELTKSFIILGEVSDDTLLVLGSQNKISEVAYMEGSPDSEKRIASLGLTPLAEEEPNKIIERFITGEISAVALRYPIVSVLKQIGDLPFTKTIKTPHILVMRTDHAAEARFLQRVLASSLRYSTDIDWMIKPVLDYASRLESEHPWIRDLVSN